MIRQRFRHRKPRSRLALFGGDDGAVGLNEPVTAAVDTAITTVEDEDLVDELFKGKVLS